jgi:hypothetical protein
MHCAFSVNYTDTIWEYEIGIEVSEKIVYPKVQLHRIQLSLFLSKYTVFLDKTRYLHGIIIRYGYESAPTTTCPHLQVIWYLLLHVSSHQECLI